MAMRTYRYDPLPGFNGEFPDPLTGHYLLGNGYRAYNPVLGRFNSPDSLSPFGEGGVNAYAYCRGDPVNRVDPSGHVEWDVVFGYAWSALAFLRGSFAFHKAWPQVKTVALGKASKPVRTLDPGIDAASRTARITAITNAAVATTQMVSGTLAFSAATARLSGADSDVYAGLMGTAVVSGVAAFGVQLTTPWLGKRLHAGLEYHYVRKLDKAFARARAAPQNTTHSSASRDSLTQRGQEIRDSAV